MYKRYPDVSNLIRLHPSLLTFFCTLTWSTIIFLSQTVYFSMRIAWSCLALNLRISSPCNFQSDPKVRVVKKVSNASWTLHRILWLVGEYFGAVLIGFSFLKSLLKSYPMIFTIYSVKGVRSVSPNHCFFYIIEPILLSHLSVLILRCEFFDSKIPTVEIVLSRLLHVSCTPSKSFRWILPHLSYDFLKSFLHHV